MTQIDPRAREAWAGRSVRSRLKVVRRFRGLLADKADWVAKDVAEATASRPEGSVGVAEVLTSEVLPLCDAAKFLQREAGYWLKPQRLGWRGRPAWLFGVASEIRREPLGTVLIIAAGNYPLFLPGVQALQALVAGNAVVLKPGRGGTAAAAWLADVLRDAGLPAGLLVVEEESVEAAERWLGGCVPAEAGTPIRRANKVFLTGSVESGRAVLAKCAETLTPACVELSGCDAVFVLPGSDEATVALAAKAVAFGLRLNGSQTCIAPRRVFVATGRIESDFACALRDEVNWFGPVPVDPGVMARVHAMFNAWWSEADASPNDKSQHRERLTGRWKPVGALEAVPFVLWGVKPTDEIAQADLFAPVVSIIRCSGDTEMLQADAACPYALGASVFGPRKEAERFARRVRAGSVTVNDLVAPTADPRLPFGGRGDSGFGVTRGAEGLLEMTRVKTVSVRRLNQHPHYDPVGDEDAAAFAAYLRTVHGPSWASRLASLPALFGGLKALSKKSGSNQGNQDDREQHES
ncbi:MAG: aldehyde dehydrogenase family protein [Planctomycetota bacterium]